MEKTAIDFVQEKLAKTDQRNLGEVITIFEEAKAMFRQQIEDAYDAGVRSQHGIQTADLKYGAKFYNNKYGEK